MTENDPRPPPSIHTAPAGGAEAFALALRHHQEQRPLEAEPLYRAVLAAQPDHADALHFLGLLCHQQGRRSEAEPLIRRALHLSPGDPDAHSSLGTVLRAAGRHDEAEQALLRALELEPGHVVALCTLGGLHQAAGRLEEAADLLQKAVRLRPDYADAHQTLADVLVALGKTAEGFEAYCRSVSLDPERAGSKKLLAYSLRQLGREREALQALDEWLAAEPDNPVALHLRAACSGTDVPPRASDAFLREAFDGFAPTFDERMRSLQYRGPQLLGAVLAQGFGRGDGAREVLDAGCGTGLCGPILRPYARRLTGVDLSPAMTAKAAATSVYDQVATAELTAFLATSPPAYHLVAAADTLIYFGPLDELLRGARGALRPGGALAVTLETADENEAPAGYVLRHHGRYAHTAGYLEGLLSAEGFAVRATETGPLRLEGGRAVAGLAVLATRGAHRAPTPRPATASPLQPASARKTRLP